MESSMERYISTKYTSYSPQWKINRHLAILILLIATLSACKNEISNINNPVIPGFNPDPSVCRVGEDYYLVTSTFEYFPGVPVYHSKDLVNWQMIGHVIHRPGQLDYSNISSTAGIYAPTIRYHRGIYYVITTMVGGLRDSIVEQKGNFIMTAQNPAGPWSDPHWIDNAPGIDPSLFFDEDNRVYYTGNRHEENSKFRAEKDIWIQEIDLDNFELKGPVSVLDSRPYFESNIIGGAAAFEAPHLYKKDGTYYLLIAHGGTGIGHAASIWKSDSPLGPWEMNPGNPILTHRGYEQSGINCTGHADIFKTDDGEWWTVFLGVRSKDKKNNVMGRETFLSKVDWSGEWPVINPDGETGRTAHSIPAPEMWDGEQRSFNFRDDFNDDQLQPDWTFIRNPKTTWWDQSTKAGYMQLKLRPEVIEDYSRPVFMGIRVIEMNCTFTTSLDFTPQKPGECAGMAFLRGHKPHWSLVKEMHENQARASVYYADSLLSGTDLRGSGELGLKITLEDFKLSFFIKEDAGDWQKICETDGHELGFPPAGRFTGSFCGLYATSRGDSNVNNVAGFDWYEMKKTAGSCSVASSP